MYALATPYRLLSRTIAALAIVAFVFGAAVASPRAAAMVMADGGHHQAEQTAADPEAHDCCQEDHPQPADNCLGDCLSACLAAASVATIERVDFVHAGLYAHDAYYGAAAPRFTSQEPEFATPPPRA